MNPLFQAGCSRRDFLWRFGGGLGGVALAQSLSTERLLAEPAGTRSIPGVLTGRLHHAPKAKRVIQLFMNGGASQMDLFDYKPELVKRKGQKFDPGRANGWKRPPANPARCWRPALSSSNTVLVVAG